MQVPYSWIKELVEIDWPAQDLAERLTVSGEEAEIDEPYLGQFGKIVVGRVIELEAIEASDHLKRAMVDTGGEKVQVVCGAPNVQLGQKVVFAGLGAELADGMIIKAVKLRGVKSTGMICSERELGLTEDHSGIIVLDDDAPVGMPIKDYLGLADVIIKLDLTPNRADLLSVVGVARDVACLAGKKLKRPDYHLTESGGDASEMVKVSIADPEACPRYAARVIKNVRIGPSPWWIKRKLLLCGIRPISNVVDITNLVLLETGHPLHAFDYDRFDRKEIMVRRAINGEKFITLDGNEHTLNQEVLLITDGEKGVAVAGIMGGLESEVSDDTTTILLESAYFNPVTVRRGRMKLGVISESSNRFEKGADPNMVPEALNRAAYLIQKYAGGEVMGGIIDCYPREIRPLKVAFRPDRANAVLGTNLTKGRMLKILQGLEFGVSGKDLLEITVPTFRPDVSREIDLIEEVARIEGLDNLPTVERNIGPLFSRPAEDDLFCDLIRRGMTAQGFDEMYGIGLANAALLSAVTGDRPQLKILNPIAEDLTVMQNDVLYSLLKAVSHNLAHRNMNLKLFEIGKAFLPDSEAVQIGLALTGRSDDQWYEPGRAYEFYHLKGALDVVCELGNFPQISFRPEPVMPYKDGSSFRLILEGQGIGHAGRVDEKVARRFDIKQPVFTAVVDFAGLYSRHRPTGAYTPLPRFPAAPRDLAVIVDEEIRVGDILDTIREVGGDLLERLNVFDMYRGRQIGEGKKSLAFAMVYRSFERSLENEEVADLQEKIANSLKERFNAEIREG
ncbi:MAG: phenylalanine--tRNA ligase subunit beta [Candidatus Zixiibacteriota bacterium]|nr:MAG: phenylalanine--tRNA ligase subunit beta [candidate division Zixibacteria bacterium]